MQGRPTKDGYENTHSRLVSEKATHILLSIKPMTEADAREFVGACNQHNVDSRVTEHFVEQVRRLE